MRKILLVFIVLNSQLFIFNCLSQPTIQWQKFYGGSAEEYGAPIVQTTDGGYIVGGSALSHDGDVNGNHDNTNNYADYWLVKIDSAGTMQWSKCYGGSNDDVSGSTIQTSDGGYIMAGTTWSHDGNVSGNHNPNNSTSDAWVVKTDVFGNILWKKCYGGSYNDGANKIIQTNDGGYIFAGYTYSNDGDVSGNHDTTHATNDYWVVKIDSTGNIQWQKCYGGTLNDEAKTIIQTADGGYAITGNSCSNTGDVTGNHGGGTDAWLIKIDSAGTLLWSKCYGGTAPYGDNSTTVIQTTDGGFIIGGGTYSHDIDCVGNHDTSGNYVDAWVIRTDGTGNEIWSKCYGGTSNDGIACLIKSNDGGYVFAGNTSSNDGDVNGNHGAHDYWIVKIDTSGTILWQQCYGGTQFDDAYSIIQTNDNGYAVVGASSSLGTHGAHDYWVIKLSQDNVGINELQTSGEIKIYPNPSKGIFRISTNSNQTLKDIIVYDVLGNIIYQQLKEKETTVTIDLSAHAKGVYFVKVIEDTRVSLSKVVLE